MSNLNDLLNSWNTTEAAGERDPLPPGEYAATLESGELATNARTGTPSFKLKLRVSDGPFAGRFVWHDLYWTEKAMAYTKRDLLKIGITNPAQLNEPLPSRFACKVKLSRVMSDNGNEINRVVRFDVIGPIADEPNPFPIGNAS